MLITNSLQLIHKGKNNVYLSGTNRVISFQYPKINLGGVIFGTRTVLWDGHMKFEDRSSNLKAIICFNKSHANLKKMRFHDIYGQIFFHDYSKDKKKNEFYESSFSKNSFPDKKFVICEITGSYLEEIFFDGISYMEVTKNQPFQIFPNKQVLPSDSRYREDLMWLKRSWLNPEYSKLYEEYSQQWKLALEAQQRLDRETREKKSKKKGK